MKPTGNLNEALRQKWLASGSFADEQTYLESLAGSGAVRLVILDPDGTLHSWLAVVVRSQTGVIYANQCEGVATKQRFVEGYLVLLGGSKYDSDGGMIDLDPLTGIFHQGDACIWSWQGRNLPTERLAMLNKRIEEIPYWRSSLDDSDSKSHLRIDKDRIEQMETPDGPSVLLYKNCD